LQSSEREAEEALALFGIDKELLKKWRIEKICSSFWLMSKDIKAFECFNIQTKGLRILEKTKLGLKPTSYGLQLLAPHIKMRTIDLSMQELLSIIKGIGVEKNAEDGYVAIRHKGIVLGCGLAKNGKIYSQFPKALAQAIAKLD